MSWRLLACGYLCGKLALLFAGTAPNVGRWQVLDVRGDTVELLPGGVEHALVLTHTRYTCSACYQHFGDSLRGWMRMLDTAARLPVLLVTGAATSGFGRRTVARWMRALCPVITEVRFAFPGGTLPEALREALQQDRFVIAYCHRGGCEWVVAYEQLERSAVERRRFLERLAQALRGFSARRGP